MSEDELTKELNELTRDVGAKCVPDIPPPALDEPDAPVLSPLKPKPKPRPGAVALPQPESGDD